MSMNDRISKTDSLEYAKKTLLKHGLSCPNGWEIALGLLLTHRGFVEVTGYGNNAQIVFR